MLKYFTYLILPIFLLFSYVEEVKTDTKIPALESHSKSECLQLYEDMNLEGIINYTVFKYAYAGYNQISVKNKDIMTVIDFSKPSTEKRLYVLDMQNKKLLYSTHVTHGRKSGENYATSFSNKPGSHQSSLGFYVTENAYLGQNGYSLILDGLEKGINDNAKQRAIVIHGADYCDVSRIGKNGRLGRSFGCPALPQDISKQIIDTIKGGTLLYIYANDEDYLNKSRFIRDFRAIRG